LPLMKQWQSHWLNMVDNNWPTRTSKLYMMSISIVRRQYVCHSTHSHSSRRSLLRCHWTTSVKQSPCRTSPHQPLHQSSVKTHLFN